MLHCSACVEWRICRSWWSSIFACGVAHPSVCFVAVAGRIILWTGGRLGTPSEADLKSFGGRVKNSFFPQNSTNKPKHTQATSKLRLSQTTTCVMKIRWYRNLFRKSWRMQWARKLAQNSTCKEGSASNSNWYKTPQNQQFPRFLPRICFLQRLSWVMACDNFFWNGRTKCVLKHPQNGLCDDLEIATFSKRMRYLRKNDTPHFWADKQ